MPPDLVITATLALEFKAGGLQSRYDIAVVIGHSGAAPKLFRRDQSIAHAGNDLDGCRQIGFASFLE